MLLSEYLDEVVVEDSYLLGWLSTGHVVVVFFDFLLTANHSNYRAFDERTEHGCYSLTEVRFDGVTLFEAPAAHSCPVWDPSLDEFTDADELCEVVLKEHEVAIIGDEIEINVKYEHACVSKVERSYVVNRVADCDFDE